MPVAMRKRNWADHVTHRSGLRYSFDDLDLVCCRGPNGGGGGSGGSGGGGDSKQHGRQVRCASLPECCHRRHPAPDAGQGAPAVALGEAGLLWEKREGGTAVDESVRSGDGPDESGDSASPRKSSGSRCLRSPLGEEEAASSPDSTDRRLSGSFSNGAVDSCDGTEHGADGDGSGLGDADVVTGACLLSEDQHQQQQQPPCISIGLDNGSPVSVPTVNQSGKHPPPNETMESHTDVHGEPSAPTDATQTSASAEPKPDVAIPPPGTDEQDHRRLSSGVVAVAADRLSAHLPAEASVGPPAVTDDATEEECGAAGTQERSRNGDAAADKAEGLDLPATLLLSPLPSALSPRGPVCPVERGNDQSCDSPTFHQSLVESLEPQDVVDVMEQNQERVEKRAPPDDRAEEEEVNQSSSSTAHGVHVEVQRCTEGINSRVLSEQQADTTGLVTNSIQCPGDENMEKRSSEDLDGSSASQDPTFADSQSSEAPRGELHEGGSSTPDTILELNSSESDDAATLATRTQPNIASHPSAAATHPPEDQPSTDTVGNSQENTATLERPQAEASAAEVGGAGGGGGDDLPPDGLPGNRRASGCYQGESPDSPRPDGQSSKHRLPDITRSTFEETLEEREVVVVEEVVVEVVEVVEVAKEEEEEEEEEATQAVATHCGPQRPTPGSHGTRASEDPKENGSVKMRVKKPDHSRLDSMGLLLMKLDQLDKEIENALSATSSVDSTPTPRRRRTREMDSLGLTLSQPGHPSHEALVPAAESSAPDLGAKPKTGNSTVYPDRDTSEIEAKEACTWLRAAGFPQYAQLYEDSLFPIDISSVTRDHDFLDRDAIEALCRRLNTLNKCALMRLDITPQRKRSEDSDEDEPCAISGRWTFQRDSKRWSRLEELEVFCSLTGGQEASSSSSPQDQSCSSASHTATTSTSTSTMLPPSLREGHSSESVLTDVSEQPEVGSLHSGGSLGGVGRPDEDGNHAAGAAREGATSVAGATRAGSVASVCSSSGTGGSMGCGANTEDSVSDGPPPSPLELVGQFTFDLRARMSRLGSLDRTAVAAAAGGGGGGADGAEEENGGGGGKTTRSRAKSFLKRMESLRLRSASSSSSSSSSSSKRKKKLSGGAGGKLDISGPVARQGLDDDKLARLHCVDIADLNHNLHHQNNNHHHPHHQHSGISVGQSTTGLSMTLMSHRGRGVPYATQNSSGSTGSTGSSQSEEASSTGSAVSTPSPVTRARSHSAAAAGGGSAKRGGMYLEGFDPFSLQAANNQSTTNSSSNKTKTKTSSSTSSSSSTTNATTTGSSSSSSSSTAATTPTTPKSAPVPVVPASSTAARGVHEQNRKNNRSRDAGGGGGSNNRANGNHPPSVDEEGEEEEEEEEPVIFFFLPEGHKPGTFPRALQDNNDSNGNAVVLRGGGGGGGTGRQSRRRQRHGSPVGSLGSDSRLSFYDNMPPPRGGGGEEEEEAETTTATEDDGHKLEEVLRHVSGLQRFVNAWSDAMTGGGEEEEEEEEEEDEEEEEEDEEEEEGDSDSALDSASPCPSSPLQNRLEEHGSDQDSTGNPLGEREGEEGMRERRDSGVGASLTRTNRPQKLRWPSFQSSHRPSEASARLQISCQSVLQMNLLQKLSLLKLTALLERHTPTNKHGFSWAVPKFMKRVKVRDYKGKSVFGVPLAVNVQRTGQPLPQGIQQAMRYLRNHCLDQVGLFRKSGVKSRIQALRQMNETCGADGGGVSYEGQSAYDVADMLKQYFRDLPEPLVTSKLSETFLQIYQYMPKELRLQAVRAAVLLLPDESREALLTLLCLLSDVTASVAENQMTPTNLAVCLAPSLFHLNTLRRKESSSPRVMNRKQTLGKPDQRDLNENLAATHGLAHMIQECRKLFRIPEEMNRCRNSYMEQALLPRQLEELGGGGGGGEEGEGAGGGARAAGGGGYRLYLQQALDALVKDAKDKFKGYDSFSTPEPAELAYKKVHDGSPLRLWKVTLEVAAGPEEVLTRVLREQGRWDEDLLESRVLETLDERTEVYQYVRASMAPHPTTDHLVLRTWVTDLPKGACALVCASVDHRAALALGVRANVLTSRYFIEPCGAHKSRLTHISRTDCRGRFPEWYNTLYGHLCAAEVVRIRDSFTVPVDK